VPSRHLQSAQAARRLSPHLMRGVRHREQFRTIGMQRLYEISFFVGVALVAGFTCTFALSLLALIQVATKAVILMLVGVLAIFVPLNILFWHFNRRRALSALKLPIPARIFDIGFGILMGLVVLMLVFGWLGWSAAPIRPSANGYVDKLGKAVTEPDYIVFQRWEAAFFAVWSATILLGVLALPFYSSKERRHIFGE